METVRPDRILVVTDRTAATPALMKAIEERTLRGPAQFRVVIPNPASAELHPLHPERHDKAAAAERVLRETLRDLEAAAGGHVIGSVSVRHDPVDAGEQILLSEPIDEIIVSVAEHGMARWLHQDLPHRLKHLGLPVTTVVGR
jgi:hypothetical protein